MIKTMKTIILIRHGECKGNREGYFRGRYDFPLNENGIKQAEALRDALKEFKIDAIYTSPLSRAVKTAEIVADGKIPVIPHEGFNNIYLGDWEGRKKEEIKNLYPEEWKIWVSEPEKLRKEGMEPLPEVQRRSFEALRKIVEEEPHETFAVVTHRAVLKPLIAACLGLFENYFWKFRVDTASYSVMEYSPERGFTLVLLNETKHLEDFVIERV